MYFIPVACGVAMALTVALIVETGKGMQRTLVRRKRQRETGYRS